MYRLQESGFPFAKNDLSYYDWLDLGSVKQFYKSRNDKAETDAMTLSMIKLLKESKGV